MNELRNTLGEVGTLMLTRRPVASPCSGGMLMVMPCDTGCWVCRVSSVMCPPLSVARRAARPPALVALAPPPSPPRTSDKLPCGWRPVGLWLGDTRLACGCASRCACVKAGSPAMPGTGSQMPMRPMRANAALLNTPQQQPRWRASREAKSVAVDVGMKWAKPVALDSAYTGRATANTNRP